MSMLCINDVRKSYMGEAGRIEALKGVSLSVGQGELKVLLGRSGSGKSTLLRLCAGHGVPDSGVVTFEGKLVMGASPERFMVFQEFAQLFPWLSVSSNIRFALKSVRKGMSKRDIDETISFFIKETGLNGFENMWPHELSGGMNQRAALARAFAIRPKLLLLDEPFCALDVHLRKSMQELLRELCSRHGIAALFVTHDIDEALALDASPAVLTPDGAQIVLTDESFDVRGDIMRLLLEVRA